MTTKQEKRIKKAKLLAKRGRPSKTSGRKVLPEEVVRELVEGIVVLDASGNEMRRMPSQLEIARSLGVAHSLVSRIAEANDCKRRHELYRRDNPEPFEEYERRHGRARTGESSEDTDDARNSGDAQRPAPATSRTTNETQPPARSTRKPGRPARVDSPAVPWNDVDRALVLGEVIELTNGTQTTRYPTVRELARRYGIAHSAIVKYSLDHQCERRREVAQQRLIQKTEEKVLELRATAAAVTKDDSLRMIDKYLHKFEQALDEDRVRYDVPADFNTMLRLREFVTGGPDSRQESTTTFTLEMLQERHARMLKTTSELTPAEMGTVEVTGHELGNRCEPAVGDDVQSHDERGEDCAEPPSRPLGRVVGQQTECEQLSADEEEGA
ncbi:MAG TPA: hypothetical protein VKP30_00390 [Polyangiaceae bacterium]|nr:hypothetical protein [Polyangiaceae bacterium]